ncbi:hypothetical protein [Methylobacterium sp. JK268]
MANQPTLDAELATWWSCEAERLDRLAAEARFGFMQRRYARKAAEARARAQVSQVREAARRGDSAAS